MINPLDELSDIYLGQISEADNSPEAVKARVMQHVRAIRYRARKEGDQLNKAYNDYMAGQAGISATEKSMVKERLGLTGGSQHQEGMAYGMYKGSGKPGGAMKAYLDKKAEKLKKEKAKLSAPYKNNPAFQSNKLNPQPKYEQVTFQQFQEKCWPGYEKKGMKTMFGKRYPNCVKKKK